MEQVKLNQKAGSSPSNGKREGTFNFQVTHIFETGLKRSFEAVKFFEKKGEASQNMLNRAFFLYLSVKKDAQRMILEKIAVSLGIELSLCCEETISDNGFELYQEEYESIFNIVHEIAADELEFYLNYAAVENDPKIKSFIMLLADLSKEFLFDTKIWYLNHKDYSYKSDAELQETPSSEYVVEKMLN